MAYQYEYAQPYHEHDDPYRATGMAGPAQFDPAGYASVNASYRHSGYGGHVRYAHAQAGAADGAVYQYGVSRYAPYPPHPRWPPSRAHEPDIRGLPRRMDPYEAEVYMRATTAAPALSRHPGVQSNVHAAANGYHPPECLCQNCARQYWDVHPDSRRSMSYASAQSIGPAMVRAMPYAAPAARHGGPYPYSGASGRLGYRPLPYPDDPRYAGTGFAVSTAPATYEESPYVGYVGPARAPASFHRDSVPYPSLALRRYSEDAAYGSYGPGRASMTGITRGSHSRPFLENRGERPIIDSRRKSETSPQAAPARNDNEGYENEHHGELYPSEVIDSSKDVSETLEVVGETGRTRRYQFVPNPDPLVKGDTAYRCANRRCLRTFHKMTAFERHTCLGTQESPDECEVRCEYPGCSRTFPSQLRMHMHQRVHRQNLAGDDHPLSPPSGRVSPSMVGCGEDPKEEVSDAPVGSASHKLKTPLPCPMPRCSYSARKVIDMTEHIMTTHAPVSKTTCPFLPCECIFQGPWLRGRMQMHVIAHCYELVQKSAAESGGDGQDDQDVSADISMPRDEPNSVPNSRRSAGDNHAASTLQRLTKQEKNARDKLGEAREVFPCQWASCTDLFAEQSLLSAHVWTHVAALPLEDDLLSCMWRGCDHLSPTFEKLVSHCESHLTASTMVVYSCVHLACGKLFGTRHEVTVHVQSSHGMRAPVEPQPTRPESCPPAPCPLPPPRRRGVAYNPSLTDSQFDALAAELVDTLHCSDAETEPTREPLKCSTPQPETRRPPKYVAVRKSPKVVPPRINVISVDDNESSDYAPSESDGKRRPKWVRGPWGTWNDKKRRNGLQNKLPPSKRRGPAKYHRRDVDNGTEPDANDNAEGEDGECAGAHSDTRSKGRRLVLFSEDPNVAPVEVFLRASSDEGSKKQTARVHKKGRAAPHGRRRGNTHTHNKSATVSSDDECALASQWVRPESRRRKPATGKVHRWGRTSSMQPLSVEADADASDCDISDGCPVMPVRIVDHSRSEMDPVCAVCVKPSTRRDLPQSPSEEAGYRARDRGARHVNGDDEDAAEKDARQQESVEGLPRTLRCDVCRRTFHPACLGTEAVGRVLRGHWLCPGCREAKATQLVESPLSVNGADVQDAFAVRFLARGGVRNIAVDKSCGEFIIG